MYRSSKLGFTLIELMIVVFMFALISAVLIPFLIRKVEVSKVPGSNQPASQAKDLPTGLTPILTNAHLRLELEVKPLQVGLDLANRYKLSHDATLEFDGTNGEEHLISIPLPKNTDIRQLKLQVRDSVGQGWSEPVDVIYQEGLLAWKTDRLPLLVRLNYLAEGDEQLVYPWPQTDRLDSLQVRAEFPNQATVVFPLGSLRPTHEAEGVYQWDDTGLLSPAPIVMKFSQVDNPLTRAGRLFRLTGLALLFFGAGFWYLSELYKPGSLKDFGFGSFFLLALTYCSFFVSVAILGLEGSLSAPTYLGLALILSQPLLVYHVCQLIDFRFAWSRALPCSALTLTIVLLGVYSSGESRNVGYLAAGLLSMGFLITTYGPFRAAVNVGKEHRRRSLEAAQQKWKELVEHSRALESRTLLWLAKPAGTAAAQIRPLIESRLSDLRNAGESNPRNDYDMLIYYQDNLGEKIAHLDRLLRQAEELTESQHFESEGVLHCSGCGTASAGGAYCCNCGHLLPKEKPCHTCSTINIHPAGESSAPVAHCYGCGELL